MYIGCILSLLFMACILPDCSAVKNHKMKTEAIEDTMNVAGIRQVQANETFVRVTFTQSQRFFKLPNDANPAYLDLLKESEKNNTPVIIKRSSVQSDVILSVRKP